MIQTDCTQPERDVEMSRAEKTLGRDWEKDLEEGGGAEGRRGGTGGAGTIWKGGAKRLDLSLESDAAGLTHIVQKTPTRVTRVAVCQCTMCVAPGTLLSIYLCMRSGG